MKIFKAIYLTISYYLLIELISLWVLLIPYEMEYEYLIKLSSFINSIATLIFLIVLFKSFKQSHFLKLEKADSKYYLSAMILGIGFVFFQSILNVFYYQDLSSKSFTYHFTLERLISFSAVASIVVIPIAEELFFRNYILRGLLENYKPSKAIILSSILFAFIHLPFFFLFNEFLDFSFHHAYITLFGGFISGVLFYKSKSIMPSIIFHIFWNLTVRII